MNPQLEHVKLKNPIEQQMMGRAGLFRQQNIERRKFMSVREWSELCAKEEMRAPSVAETDLHARATNGAARPSATTTTRRSGRRKTRGTETAEPEIIPEAIVKEERADDDHEAVNVACVTEDNSEKSPSETLAALAEEDTSVVQPDTLDSAHVPAAEDDEHEHDEDKQITKGRRNGNSRKAREAALAQRAAKDKVFLEGFKPHDDWLPDNTKAEDYTPEFCKELERRYWRSCGLGKSAWYGADMAGNCLLPAFIVLELIALFRLPVY